MSLDVSLVRVQPCCVFDANITHNLTKMADEAGIYGIVWRPEENGIERAEQLIEPLHKAITMMEREPERFDKFNASNGWGTREQFIPWLRKYLEACQQYPDAKVEASR